MAKMSDMRIISLDLETSGLVPGTHVPLSIGAVELSADLININDDNSFYVQLEWDSLTVVPDALRINKLDIVNPPGRTGVFYDRSLPGLEGIEAFSKWLGGPSSVPLIAMGKNVGSFDLPMLKSIWKGRWPFHYRSIDLNTLFIALSQITNLSFDIVKDKITQRAWEILRNNRLMEEGEEYCLAHSEHNAFSDAWWNVYAWQECLKWFKELQNNGTKSSDI